MANNVTKNPKGVRKQFGSTRSLVSKQLSAVNNARKRNIANTFPWDKPNSSSGHLANTKHVPTAKTPPLQQKKAKRGAGPGPR